MSSFHAATVTERVDEGHMFPGFIEGEEGKDDGSGINMDAVAASLEEAVARAPLSPTGGRSSSSIPTSELETPSFSLTTASAPTTSVSSFATSVTRSTTTTTSTTTSPSSSFSSTAPPPPLLNPRRLSGAGSHENFSPQVIQRLAKEVRELMTSPPEGVTFVPNEEETLMEIHADMQGPVGTPYEEGVFRLKLVLSRNYPHSPPRAFFLTKIYHPNVAGSGGDVCVDVLKRTWSADIKLGHTLQVIRCLLIVPFPESSLNDEAGRLFMRSYAEYARRAKLYTTVHAKVLSAAAHTATSPKHDCKVSPADAGGHEAGVDGSAAKGPAAKGGSSTLSLSAATGAGGGKSGGEVGRGDGAGEEKGVASKVTQQQRSKDARRKSLKRL